MPAVYEQPGIHFEYPDNWSVERQSLDPSIAADQVVVSSPETAFWHLSKHPPEADLEGLFDDALGALRSEYKEMEATPASETLEDRLVAGFDVNFYCLDLTNTSWLRGFKTPSATYLLICQAEDGELERAGPVFRAMLASLLRNL
jgi:hypothetical protein